MQAHRHAIESHIPALRRYARVLRPDPTEAEDLVQESLAKALARVTVWTEIRDVRAFLFTIMHNLHIDQARRDARGRAGIPLDAIAEQQAASAPRQPLVLELKEAHAAMEALSAEQRRTLQLVSLDGLSYREVSERMRVPVGTVMSRLARGREALRRRLAG